MIIEILPVRNEFDTAICRVIKAVGEEFNACGEGFGPGDAEVEQMSAHYVEENNSLYLVALIDNAVVGGCGIAAFNSDTEICELRKLFLTPQARGLGIGEALARQCLEFARSRGFKQCYLESLASMERAILLYRKLGFETLNEALKGSEHDACNVWMIKTIST